MALRFYKAYTPGTRNRSVADCTELTKTRPEKSLTRSLHRSKGRNNRGVITCRHRGGGHKRLYRQIDFRRNKYDMSASVKTIEYDPNRNARIALVEYEDGEKRYILHPTGLQIGDSIVASETATNSIGNSLPLMAMPLGVQVHNIEMHPKWVTGSMWAHIKQDEATWLRIISKPLLIPQKATEGSTIRSCMDKVGSAIIY